MSDVIVVGEALVDLVVALDGSVEATLGGAPFNTARACGRLDGDVAFVGAISDDRFGRALRARLVDDGVDVGGVVEVEQPTTLAAAGPDEHRAATYRFYLEGTSAPALGRVAPLGPDAGIVYTGGLALVLEPMADAVAAMVAALAGRPAAARPIVFVDVNARPHVIGDRSRYLERLSSVLAGTDVVKVSDDDLAVIAPDVDALDAARSLLDRGPSVALLTAGAEEVVVVHRAPGADPITERRVPVEPVEVVDTIGAGDAFGGGVCAWWTVTGRTRADLADPSMVERAVRAGVVVAGITCTRRGADPPRAAELPVSLVDI
ncbi:MAG: PfkB family carbohydrate kinase [Ilumatobacteraceae bacterium]